MIPILGIALALVIGLPAIAQKQIHIIQLEQQLIELDAESCPKDGEAPLPGCGRRDK